MRILAAAMLATAMIVTAGGVASADVARLERVMLLPLRDRVSVVFEMSGEPFVVTSRSISGAVLEVDVEPATAAATEPLAAPAGMRLVHAVAVERVPTARGGALRARVRLRETARASVRIVGRRVYVDFTADLAAPGGVPARRGASTRPGRPRDPARACAEGLAPALAQLDRMAPFLLSAAAAPSPPVDAALQGALAALDATARAVPPSDECRSSHALLVSAIELASRAMTTAVAGDRVPAAREAVTVLQRAKTAAGVL